MQRPVIASFFLFAAFSAAAQERFGISHSNYAGADGAYLNPARLAGQWPYADIRVLGADLYAWNSLVAWSHRTSPLIGEVREGIAGNTAGEVVMRNTLSTRQERGFVQANVLAPAFSLSLGRGTIAAGIRTRTYTSVTGPSNELGELMFRGLAYVPLHGTRYQESGMRVLAAAWTEIGASYGHILKAEGFSMFSAGASVHYNLGHAGGGAQFDDLDFTLVDTARLVVHDVTARYGFALPEVKAGSGWGADVGVSYERTMDEADSYLPHRVSGSCDPMRYRYRIGLSLIDLGGIRFKNGHSGTISAGSLDIADHTNVPVNDADDLDSLFAATSNWTQNDAFSIGAPTALSLQYDQRIVDNAYVALAAVQQISGRHGTRLRRTNSIAITPRFETRYFEVAVPIVMHEYIVRRPSVGFMMRVNGLVVGSDHVLPFIDRSDVYAADFYVRLRWLIHRSPFCKGKRASPARHRVGTTQALPCAQPN